jgi:phosphoglycolate phosphatase-like HAD superfamily hydrolase
VENIGRYHCVGSFEGVVYVGDGVWDARAARNLGFPFIGISPEPGKAARLHAEGACRVFGDYLDAAAFMTAVDEAWDLAPPAH